MEIGLLWYDDNPRHSLAEKVRLAAERYEEKFGEPANTCFLHPLTFDNPGSGRYIVAPQALIGEVHIEPSASVLLHHFWVGREEKVS